MTSKLITAFFSLFFLTAVCASAQISTEQQRQWKWVKGQKYSKIAIGKDTFLTVEFPDLPVTSNRVFKDEAEQNLYWKYRRYAPMVYPYALEAVKNYRELQEESKNLDEDGRRALIKTMQKDLENRFEKPLKNLSKTQGKLLIKMVERALDKPMYSIVKELRGGWTAFYWNAFGSFYGYHLKDGYHRGEDAPMDWVLDEFDIPN